MPSYEIMRWDAVMPKNNNFPYPMIYIKPDSDFLSYINENNYMFLATVRGTGLQYDSGPVIAVANLSGYFPNFRPYFFNDTGYYVLVLLTNWLGYPDTNGTVEIQGTKGPDSVKEEPPRAFQVPKPIEWYHDEDGDANQEKPLGMREIGWIFLTILIIFSVLLFASAKKKRKE